MYVADEFRVASSSGRDHWHNDLNGKVGVDKRGKGRGGRSRSLIRNRMQLLNENERPDSGRIGFYRQQQQQFRASRNGRRNLKRYDVLEHVRRWVHRDKDRWIENSFAIFYSIECFLFPNNYIYIYILLKQVTFFCQTVNWIYLN